MQFEKQAAGRTAIAAIGPAHIGRMHPDRSGRHEQATAGGGSRRRGEGRLVVVDAGATRAPLGHGAVGGGVAGAPAIVMPNGFQHLAGATMLYGPEPETTGSWLDPDTWWSAAVAALSWLWSQIVEGFALSAAVTHSEFIWPLGEYLDGDGSQTVGIERGKTNVRHRAPTEHEVVRYRPLRGVRQIQPAVEGTTGADLSSGSDPSWSQWTMSILTGLRSKAVRRRKLKRMSTDWQAIDDRTLKDIGLSRCDVGLIVGDLRRWD